MISWITHAFWLVPVYDLLEEKCIDDVAKLTSKHNKFMLFLLYSTMDFILPWVCFAVTDHRRLQNVERSRSEIFQIFCCDHIFDVICDLLLDRRTETQNRYVTFTITGSKTGRQRHFFSKTLFTSLFPLHRLFPPIQPTTQGPGGEYHIAKRLGFVT